MFRLYIVCSIPSKALLNATNKYAELKQLKKLGISAESATIDLKALMGFKDRTVSGLTRGIESLLKKYGAEYIQGRGTFISEHELEVNNSTKLEGKNVVIATGSYPAPYPGKIELAIDGDRIVTSDHAIAFSEIPERLVVIGGGVIGLELGSVWARLGSKVTIIDHSSHALSAADTEIALALNKSLSSHGGLTFRTNAEVSALAEDKTSITVKVNGKSEVIPFDKLLIATGRKPFTKGLGLERVGVTLDRRGFVEVNDRLQSRAHSHVYAIGDVAPGPMLAHKASEEGMAVADHINKPEAAHFPTHLHIPSVVYTHPEVAWVGHREDDLVAQGVKFKKGSFPFMANSRSRCNGQTDGFVKVLVDENDKLIGAHIMAPHAGELIAPLVVGMTYGASSRDLANVSHAHPTESEAIKEACLAAHFKPIHF